MAHLAKGKDISRVDLPFNDLGSEHVELLLLEELYGSNTWETLTSCPCLHCNYGALPRWPRRSGPSCLRHHDGRLSSCAPFWIETLWVAPSTLPPQDQAAHPLPPNKAEKFPLQHIESGVVRRIELPNSCVLSKNHATRLNSYYLSIALQFAIMDIILWYLDRHDTSNWRIHI